MDGFSPSDRWPPMLIDLGRLELAYEVRDINPALPWWRHMFGGAYKSLPVLQGLDLTVSGRGITAVLGRNGSGKTTLMKLLSGILTPTRGRISVLGHEPSRRSNDFLRQIGAVFGQKRMLWPELSLSENFALTRAVYRIAPAQYAKRSVELTELFGLRPLAERPVKSYSLGEAMKAEIANVLLFEPRLLFLDEPTIGLDVSAQRTLRQAIKDYAATRDCHILLTSHYMRDVAELADRVLLLSGGRFTEISSDGDTEGEFERRLERELLEP